MRFRMGRASGGQGAPRRPRSVTAARDVARGAPPHHPSGEPRPLRKTPFQQWVASSWRRFGGVRRLSVPRPDRHRHSDSARSIRRRRRDWRIRRMQSARAIELEVRRSKRWRDAPIASPAARGTGEGRGAREAGRIRSGIERSLHRPHGQTRRLQRRSPSSRPPLGGGGPQSLVNACADEAPAPRASRLRRNSWALSRSGNGRLTSKAASSSRKASSWRFSFSSA